MVCTRCKTDKAEVDFYPCAIKRRKPFWCKVCMNESTASWALRNPEKARAVARKTRAKHRVRRNQEKRLRRPKVGLTKDQFVVMLASQEHCCKICDVPLIGKMLPNADHDHRTGKVRGLLCCSCNRGIGLLKDNPAVLTRAAQYVS